MRRRGLAVRTHFACLVKRSSDYLIPEEKKKNVDVSSHGFHAHVHPSHTHPQHVTQSPFTSSHLTHSSPTPHTLAPHTLTPHHISHTHHPHLTHHTHPLTPHILMHTLTPHPYGLLKATAYTTFLCPSNNSSSSPEDPCHTLHVLS